MKLVLFADLHLDAPFEWAGPDLARTRRIRLQDVLARIVDLAMTEEADALLCAGDLYEHDRFGPDTGELLRAQFARLGATPVYVSPGNHDWCGPGSLYHSVEWSSNVHVFRDDALVPIELTDGLTLWGAAHTRPRGTAGFVDGFTVDRGGVNLALFHGSETATLAFQGSGKEAFAPFTAAQIEAAGIDHALVGHFHVPRHTDRYTYPGNPEPLEFGETGERGAVVAEVDATGSVHARTVLVAQTPLHDIEIDITGSGSGHDIRTRTRDALEALSGIVRVTYSGELLPDVDFKIDDVRDVAPHLEALVPRIGSIQVAYDIDALTAQPTVEGQFVRSVVEAGFDDDERRRIIVTGLRALHGRDDLEVV